MTGKRVTFFQYIRNIINKFSITIALNSCYLYARFEAIFEFMIENNLLSSTYSGFKPNDSCVNHVISIVYSIFSAFDANPLLEVWGVFLDLSEAFYRVWHEGIPYRLKKSGINSNLDFDLINSNFDLIESFLHDRRLKCCLKWSVLQLWIRKT